MSGKTMEKIALATCREYADLTVEDKLLADCLRNLGFDPKPLVWNEPNQSLADSSAVVVRSCWDYHKKPQEFLAWIGKLESNGVKVLNPPNILRWNVDKTYLRELEKSGVKIPPTVWFEKGAAGSLSKILAENYWQKAVLKPTISATAWRTFIVTPENADELQPELENLLLTGGAMVQKFVAEIQTKGEWSFVFFNKEFSHAVLKRAKTGDFRVQDNFGGSVEMSVEPAAALVETAQKIVENIGEDLLYARVDGAEIAGEFCLMELELIEPVFFLENNLSAATKFAAAIARRLEPTNVKTTNQMVGF
ncbi:MAG: ATP-grasp domain-containing protein [Pyrinomonadaceae bacterium]